jgi:hypothetical protein
MSYRFAVLIFSAAFCDGEDVQSRTGSSGMVCEKIVIAPQVSSERERCLQQAVAVSSELAAKCALTKITLAADWDVVGDLLIGPSEHHLSNEAYWRDYVQIKAQDRPGVCQVIRAGSAMEERWMLGKQQTAVKRNNIAEALSVTDAITLLWFTITRMPGVDQSARMFFVVGDGQFDRRQAGAVTAKLRQYLYLDLLEVQYARSASQFFLADGFPYRNPWLLPSGVALHELNSARVLRCKGSRDVVRCTGKL